VPSFREAAYQGVPGAFSHEACLTFLPTYEPFGNPTFAAVIEADFFDWLEAHGGTVLADDRDARRHAIAASVAGKTRIVEDDERETSGRRALLNLGHTFGHALEAETGYCERLLHGEAVAAGIVLAFDFSATHGLCSAEDAARVRGHLAASGPHDVE